MIPTVASISRLSWFLTRWTRRLLKRFGLSRGAPPRNAIRDHYNYVLSLAAKCAAPHISQRPFLALVVPVYNTPPEYLDALVVSVRTQRWSAWELILSDDGSTAQPVSAWLDAHAADADLRIVRNPYNQGIAGATNAGIAVATAPWIGFLDHDDALAPGALDRIAEALEGAPDCQFLYTDEVVTDARLNPLDIFFKPAFDPVLLSGVNYTNHLSLYRRDRLASIGGLRDGFNGSQDYDLTLRYTQDLTPAQCLHVPYPAYLWRRSDEAFSHAHRDEAIANARRALSEAYSRNGAPAQIDPAGDGSLHRVRLDAQRRDWPLVSIVIPSREALPLISRILKGVTQETDYPALEVIVVDNGSKSEEVLALYEHYRDGPIPFQAVVDERPFNFSYSVNKGMALAEGEHILLLNNDTEILDPGWLKEMVSCLDYPDVGIVGAKLLYPNGTLQHAGVIAGLGTLAGHWFIGRPGDFPGPMGRLWVRQSMTVVTGACFLITRKCLDDVGPFDAEKFAVAYNDVDFCLRAVAKRHRVVWTPFARLTHYESVSRGSDRLAKNIERFLREQKNLEERHATSRYEDRAFNPWYTKDRSEPEPRLLDRLPAARR